ncbi:hypothetical protein [Thermorudis peleae]|uniref:hypothetical protein n=1 Tax=Thermorudis peleae TaxID=1382356 RepID=UPI00068AB72B|nr:hypothetical protein [Thermorudis peleae]
MSPLWPWLSLIFLGAFHGVNPAMGWLFAVALGLQERRTRAVVEAMGPIALGHALAIGVVAVVVGVLRVVLPQWLLLLFGGVAILGFAAYKLVTRFRHPRWVGFRVKPYELVIWSALMATAHGAGLMLVPVIAALRGGPAPNVGGHAAHLVLAGQSLGMALLAVVVHTVAMLVVMAAVALVVYHELGVDILRSAWINLDFIWLAALVLAGGITLALGLWPVVHGTAHLSVLGRTG